jgi:membrane-associated phospholipid phosphatase
MRTLVVAGLAALALPGAAWAAEPLTHSERQVENAGNVLQYAIPAAGLLATWLLDPRPEAGNGTGSHWLLMGGTPRHDLFLAIGRSWATTAALKYSVNETRPDGGPYSFPSGHTSLAFTGAEFIRKEYGWGWGAPAYLFAGFVGFSRVDAHRHYKHDVLAGAAIGILANHDFWSRKTSVGYASLAPTVFHAHHNHGAGLELKLKFP